MSKRQRTDDAQEDAQIQPPKRSTFWFDDGNVILQAENTQFRVHRSLMSLHSNVFKDMFSMPQPTDTMTMRSVDGCPVITLFDKASDLEYILSIFYENIRAHDMREKMSIDLLAAILRLGKKYQIDYLCDEGLKRLRRDFPKTSDQWNAPSAYSDISDDVKAHDILQLCHEISISSCLPTAYMVFVTERTLDNIMDMSIDYGGVVDREIIRNSVRGRDKLIQASHDVHKGWAEEELYSPSLSCSSFSICFRNKLLVSQSLFPTLDGFIHQLGPWDRKPRLRLCISCIGSLAVAHEKAREELWDRLPSFFGLPPWEELKDFDA